MENKPWSQLTIFGGVSEQKAYPALCLVSRKCLVSSVAWSFPTLCDPMDCSTPGFPITNSQSLLRLTSIESVMPSNHLILCHPHLLPLIFLSIRVFSKESVLPVRWPEYWSFSFSISHPNEYSGLIFFRIDWFDHQCLIKVSVNIDVVISMGFSGGSVVKNPPANVEDAEMQVPSLDWEDPSGEGNGNPLSILA